MENKKFQIRTGTKIDENNYIKLTFGGLHPGWVTLSREKLNSATCARHNFKGTEPFLQKSGEFTFLKTSTQLQIWFDDVFEVTWVFKDNKDVCNMKGTFSGLKFEGSNAKDTVSTHYRYQTGEVPLSVIISIKIPGRLLICSLRISNPFLADVVHKSINEHYIKFKFFDLEQLLIIIALA